MERLLNPKRVMADMVASAILIFSVFFTGVAQAQYCEAPTIFENGVRKSTQVTIHFKEKVFDLPIGLWQAQIGDVASSFSQLRQHFTGLEKRYGGVSFIKQIPNARWGEVWQRHKRTGELVRLHDMSQLFVVKFAQFVPIDSIIAALEKLPEVEYAHRPIEAISLADPNDPSYPSQWNLAKIEAAKAWDITTGATNIIVGIVEDGQGATESGLPDKITMIFIQAAEQQETANSFLAKAMLEEQDRMPLVSLESSEEQPTMAMGSRVWDGISK